MMTVIFANPPNICYLFLKKHDKTFRLTAHSTLEIFHAGKN